METAYEATFILDTHYAEEQVVGIIDKYSGVVTRGGGTIDDTDRWDPRRLAYEIKGKREGLYVIMNFRSEPVAKDELDRIFRISDDVLRHLIIKQDPNADRAPSKTRHAENERREREQAARQAAYPSAYPSAAPVTEIAAPAEAIPTPEVPDPAVATDAGLEPVPALAETADAQDPLASQPTAPTDAQPDANGQPANAGAPDAASVPNAAPDEEATGTNTSIA
jgi:small subunit ribosomal protein S6